MKLDVINLLASQISNFILFALTLKPINVLRIHIDSSKAAATMCDYGDNSNDNDNNDDSDSDYQHNTSPQLSTGKNKRCAHMIAYHV